MSSDTKELYALSAMFESADELLAAVDSLRRKGYRCLDAYTPFPVEGLAEALGSRDDGVRWFVLAGTVVGGVLAFVLQWYSAVIDYPINVGGRPLNSWPAFLPVSFEMAVLLGAFSGFFGMLALNGLPRLHHPMFGAEHFGEATRKRFFVVVEARDPAFDREETAADLSDLDPLDVVEVPS